MFEALIFFVAGCGVMAAMIPPVIIVTVIVTLWYGKYYWRERKTNGCRNWFRRSDIMKTFINGLWPVKIQLPDNLSDVYTANVDQPVLIAAHPHGICTTALSAFAFYGSHSESHWLTQIIGDPSSGRAAATRWLTSMPLICDLCFHLGIFSVSKESITRALFSDKKSHRHSVLLHPGGLEEVIGECEHKPRGPYIECHKHLGFLRLLWDNRCKHHVPLFPVYYRGEYRRAVMSAPLPQLSRIGKTWLWGFPLGCFWRPRLGRHYTVVEVFGPLWAKNYNTFKEFSEAYQKEIKQACQREIDDDDDDDDISKED